MGRLKRTPKNYDAIQSPAKQLSDLLPEWLGKASVRFQEEPELILRTWPEIVGEKIAPMATAISFIEGVLTVKVQNSSLYSLFVQHEKERLCRELQKRFPAVKIYKIVFRLG